MGNRKNEKVMRTAADVRHEMEGWKEKLQHAEERRCELLARWHSIDEMKRGLLAEFVERIEDDIIWMGNEVALCECELLGREDDSPTSPEDTAYRRGVAATHPEDVGQPTRREDEDYPSVACADSSPDKGSQGVTHPEDVGQPTTREEEDYPSVSCADSSPNAPKSPQSGVSGSAALGFGKSARAGRVSPVRGATAKDKGSQGVPEPTEMEG